jgi:hypothetical protein
LVVLVLKDGLGNQLFQYAAARHLAHRLNTDLKLDISHYQVNKVRTYSLHHFAIREQFITSAERNRLQTRHRISKLLNKIGIKLRSFRYHEKGFEFKPEFLNLPDDIFIEGYWQTEKNFIGIEDIIRRELVVKEPPHGKNQAYLEEMEKVNAVSVHVRRGDYVTDANINSIHGVCDLDYYKRALAYIVEQVSSPHFFIFSDDMDWVRENLPIPGHPVYYVDHNGAKDYEDLRLMYSCKHHIIANSSFSWWGAWLNDDSGKIVIAPANWFKSTYTNNDLVPDRWIRL